MLNKITATSIVCKNYDYETDTIENVLDAVETDKELKGNFKLYIAAKVYGSEFYHLFIYLKSDGKIRSIGDFKVPEEKEDREKEVYNYRIIYNMTDFDFPSKGTYEILLYGLTEEKFLSQLNSYAEKERKRAMFDYLKTNDSETLLDKTVFEVI